MTPYSLNPPGPSIQAGQNQLFNISPNNQDCRTFFNIFDPRQTSIEIGGLRENYRQARSYMFNSFFYILLFDQSLSLIIFYLI